MRANLACRKPRSSSENLRYDGPSTAVFGREWIRGYDGCKHMYLNLHTSTGKWAPEIRERDVPLSSIQTWLPSDKPGDYGMAHKVQPLPLNLLFAVPWIPLEPGVLSHTEFKRCTVEKLNKPSTWVDSYSNEKTLDVPMNPRLRSFRIPWLTALKFNRHLADDSSRSKCLNTTIPRDTE